MSFVYMAGLENTGHHLWHDSILPQVNVTISNASQWILKAELENYRDKDTKTEISNLLLAESKTPRTKAIISCSYPCYTTNINPNLNELIAILRPLNLSVKFVIMTRSPLYEVVRTFNINRIRHLSNACKALRRDLQSMRKHEFICLEYHRSVQDAPRVSNFIGINITQTMHDKFRPTNRQHASSQKIRHLNATHTWKTFHQCNNQILAICNHT